MRKTKGFTLIELLVVIVIIGILATFLVPSIVGAPARARDVGRLAAMNAMKTSLTAFFADKGYFPPGEICFSGPIPETGTEGGTTMQLGDSPAPGITSADDVLADLRPYFEGGKFPADPQKAAFITTSGGKISSCNGFLYRSVKSTSTSRPHSGYLITAVAEIEANATQNCSEIGKIAYLTPASDATNDPAIVDADPDDSQTWCQMVTGS